uniref:Uncharacterized protein n=1 Tax=Glossina brevipalpis TaxID=37001 RepID=A0A1A9W6R5_9MUSC
MVGPIIVRVLYRLILSALLGRGSNHISMTDFVILAALWHSVSASGLTLGSICLLFTKFDHVRKVLLTDVERNAFLSDAEEQSPQVILSTACLSSSELNKSSTNCTKYCKFKKLLAAACFIVSVSFKYRFISLTFAVIYALRPTSGMNSSHSWKRLVVLVLPKSLSLCLIMMTRKLLFSTIVSLLVMLAALCSPLFSKLLSLELLGTFESLCICY